VTHPVRESNLEPAKQPFVATGTFGRADDFLTNY
jgi:hypothetical protein